MGNMDNISIRTDGVLYAGEHNYDSLVVEGLEHYGNMEYSLLIEASDGKKYQSALGADSRIKIEACMIPCAGRMSAILTGKSEDENITALSGTFIFPVFDALDGTDTETPPAYEAAQTLAEQAISAAQRAEAAAERAEAAAGSTGEAAQWRKIQQAELTEAVNTIVITQDENGSPLDLNEIMILGRFQNDSAIAGVLSVQINDIGAAGLSGASYPSTQDLSKVWTKFRLTNTGLCWDGYGHTASNTSGSGDGNTITSAKRSFNFIGTSGPAQNIILAPGSSTYKFTVGTSFEIWGR